MFSLESLNELQQKIALDTEGAVLVSAGAGSGKTRLLTHRIVHLIEDKGVNPENILAITFTNKATNEMRERINQMTSNGAVWISTFHAMCAKILRENIYHLDGYNRYFTIYDTSDRDKVIKQVVKQLNLEDEFKNKLDYHISNAKNEGLLPDAYGKLFAYDPDIKNIVLGYAKYEETLKANNALDFDDLLMKTLYLFETCPNVASYYQEKFHYILVDEFQDTNTIQYKLVKILSAKHHNIFVVGDEDQCIYGWRGANIENIRNFISEFDNVKVYKLEQNYRSTKNIISGANKLIKNNTSRIDKTLYTENADGDKITYHTADDEAGEADYVARTIHNLTLSGVPYTDIGVLMRISSLSRLIEEKLLNYNIPFTVSGIFKFFERLEIKNILAYLSIVVNPKDNNAVVRIINYPKRGIGQATIDKLLDISTTTGKSLVEIIDNIDDYDIGSARLKLRDFATLLDGIRSSYESMGMTDFVKDLLKQTGINDLYNTKVEEDINRKLNIDQFVQSVDTYEKNNEGDGIIDYLQSVTLQNDMQNEDSDDTVSVSTVHASKGLEFNYVFIIGSEEGIFPLSRALDNDDELEEERRLMYVAVTRAKKKLYITRSKSRFLYGKRSYTVESRFLKEMGLVTPAPQQSFRFGAEPTGYSNFGNKSYGYSDTKYNESKFSEPKFSYGDDEGFASKTKVSTSNPWEVKLNTAKPATKAGSDGFDVGVTVEHPKYGVGNVIEVEGSGDNKSVKVNFNTVGVKAFILSFAPLKIVK